MHGLVHKDILFKRVALGHKNIAVALFKLFVFDVYTSQLQVLKINFKPVHASNTHLPI